jgi:hypothetical protein
METASNGLQHKNKIHLDNSDGMHANANINSQKPSEKQEKIVNLIINAMKSHTAISKGILQIIGYLDSLLLFSTDSMMS